MRTGAPTCKIFCSSPSEPAATTKHSKSVTTSIMPPAICSSGAARIFGVADEGGYWPEFASHEAVFEFLMQSIEAAGYTPGRQAALALDLAASDLVRPATSAATTCGWKTARSRPSR